MTTNSNWGGLAPIQVRRIKSDIIRIVPAGISLAVRDHSALLP
jgi:hypothetical protein